MIGQKLVFMLGLLCKKRKRVVFCAFNGRYGDSPQSVSRALYEKNPEIEQVWLVKQENMDLVPKCIKVENIESFKAKWILATSKVIVDNTWGAISIFKRGNSVKQNISFKLKKKLLGLHKQFFITTWHGTPIKKIGVDETSNMNFTDFYVNNGYIYIDNKYTADILNRTTFNNFDTKVIGLARNDVFFRDESELLKEKLGIKRKSKVVLFAPTFRNTGNKENDIRKSGLEQINEIEFEKLFSALEKRFNGEWVFVARFHYLVEKNVDWEKIEKKYEGKVINGNRYPDMADYLACADVLISDLSSCMMDYMVSKKPCFIYMKEDEIKTLTEEDLYFSLESLPFILSTGFQELIRNIELFDEDDYEKALVAFQKKLGFINQPVSGLIAEDIVEMLKFEDDM